MQESITLPIVRPEAHRVHKRIREHDGMFFKHNPEPVVEQVVRNSRANGCTERVPCMDQLPSDIVIPTAHLEADNVQQLYSATSTLISISVVHQPPSERTPAVFRSYSGWSSERCCRSTDVCCRTSLVLHYKRQLRIFKIEKFVFITSACLRPGTASLLSG